MRLLFRLLKHLADFSELSREEGSISVKLITGQSQSWTHLLQKVSVRIRRATGRRAGPGRSLARRAVMKY